MLFEKLRLCFSLSHTSPPKIFGTQNKTNRKKHSQEVSDPIQPFPSLPEMQSCESTHRTVPLRNFRVSARASWSLLRRISVAPKIIPELLIGRSTFPEQSVGSSQQPFPLTFSAPKVICTAQFAQNSVIPPLFATRHRRNGGARELPRYRWR